MERHEEVEGGHGEGPDERAAAEEVTEHREPVLPLHVGGARGPGARGEQAARAGREPAAEAEQAHEVHEVLPPAEEQGEPSGSGSPGRRVLRREAERSLGPRVAVLQGRGDRFQARVSVVGNQGRARRRGRACPAP